MLPEKWPDRLDTTNTNNGKFLSHSLYVQSMCAGKVESNFMNPIKTIEVKNMNK